MSDDEEALEIDRTTYVGPSAPDSDDSNSGQERWSESRVDNEDGEDGGNDDADRESTPLNGHRSTTVTEVSPDPADGSTSPYVPELSEHESPPPPSYTLMTPVKRRTLPPIKGAPSRSVDRTTEHSVPRNSDRRESYELRAPPSQPSRSRDAREEMTSQTSEHLPDYDQVMGKTRETTFTHVNPPPYVAVGVNFRTAVRLTLGSPTRLHVSGETQSVNAAFDHISDSVLNSAGDEPEDAADQTDTPEQREQTERNSELAERQQSVDEPPPCSSCMPTLAERMGCTDRYERVLDTLKESTALKIFILFILITLLSVILFPIQFSYIEYHQWGLEVRKSTGYVNSNKTYEFGCYILGADKEFLYLPRSVQSVLYTNLDMFTKDNVAVSLNVQLFYNIRYDGAGKIYDNFKFHYHDVIVKTAKSTIRNCAPRVIETDYLYNRTGVEQLLHGALKEKFSGFGIDVMYFNILDVVLPKSVEQLLLQKLLIFVQTAQLIAERDASLIQLETDRQVQQITLQAAEVTNNATYRARATLMLAGVDKRNVLEVHHSTAFNNLTERVGVTSEEHALSYFYLATLRTHPNYRGAIGYDQLLKFTRGRT